MPGQDAVQAFVWMTPQLQPDWNTDGNPYLLFMLVTGFAVDADGYSLDPDDPNVSPYNQVQTFLSCSGDETAESLRSKASTFVRSSYNRPTMPITFILDAEATL